MEIQIVPTKWQNTRIAEAAQADEILYTNVKSFQRFHGKQAGSQVQGRWLMVGDWSSDAAGCREPNLEYTNMKKVAKWSQSEPKRIKHVPKWDYWNISKRQIDEGAKEDQPLWMCRWFWKPTVAQRLPKWLPKWSRHHTKCQPTIDWTMATDCNRFDANCINLWHLNGAKMGEELVANFT